MDENSKLLLARNTRSRSNSLTEANSCHVLNFEKPITIETPGTYILNSIDSGCSFSLFNNVIQTKFAQQLTNSIDSLKTLKQFQAANSSHLLPRLSAWYGPIDYAYSTIVMRANNIAELPIISAAYNHISDTILVPNGIANNSDCFLINKYRNGKDSVGEHSDNEPEIDQTSPIITLSIGHPRTMLIREISQPGNAISIRLKPGSVLIMNGSEFQKTYAHQIPKDLSCDQPRISITFRTCNPIIVDNRKALSTPINKMYIPPSVANLPSVSNIPKKRRSSVPAVGSPIGSPKGSPTIKSPFNSPFSQNSTDSNSKSKFSKADCESLPLSLDALLEAADHLKDITVKQELLRHGTTCTASSPAERKRKLKSAIKDSHKKYIAKSLAMNEPDSVTFITMISTLEESIINLQQEIQTQSATIESLMLSESPEKSTTKTPSSPSKELATLGARLEKIEDQMNTLNQNQQDVSETTGKCKEILETVKSESTESCNRLRSLQMPEKHPQRSNHTHTRNTETHHQQEHYSPNISHNNRARPRMPSRNVLLIHDSQMNAFVPENFSSSFSVEKYKAGSYNDLLNKHMRNVISKPAVDCYVLQLGVNDYRYDPTEATLSKSIEDTKNSIEKLLQLSSAKIIVSLPTPTPGDLAAQTSGYVEKITHYITEKRKTSDLYRRLFTINNQTNFTRVIEESKTSNLKPSPISSDNLHVSPYGLKKLCTNIKFGLYRCFGIGMPRKQTPPQR